MKIDNIKEEVAHGMEHLKKKNQTNTKWKATQADKNRQKTESQNVKMK
jgi:hypothetical protein